jgi:hypothetical protein
MRLENCIMTSPRSRIIDLIVLGAIAAEHIDAALAVVQ